jgi:hypothetical protein
MHAPIVQLAVLSEKDMEENPLPHKSVWWVWGVLPDLSPMQSMEHKNPEIVIISTSHGLDSSLLPIFCLMSYDSSSSVRIE